MVLPTNLGDFPEIPFDTSSSRDDFSGVRNITQKPKLIDLIRENLFKKLIKIRVGNEDFMCSLQVLKAYSDYFKKVHESVYEVVLDSDKVSPEIFGLIYKWMCSESTDIEAELIEKMFEAAKYLVIPNILQQLDKGNAFNYSAMDDSI